jgi:hypothetical protein
MSRKNRKRLKQLINKKQQIQSIASEPANIASTPVTVTPIHQPIMATTENQPIANEPNRIADESEESSLHPLQKRELKRTLASVVIIALLLVGTIILDSKSPFLTDFGSTLYRVLRLANG